MAALNLALMWSVSSVGAFTSLLLCGTLFDETLVMLSSATYRSTDREYCNVVRTQVCKLMNALQGQVHTTHFDGSVHLEKVTLLISRNAANKII